MACSIEGIQPEFVPPGLLCSDTYCDQLAELLVNESALDELWRAQGKQNSSSSTSLLKIVQQRFFWGLRFVFGGVWAQKYTTGCCLSLQHCCVCI